jgi:hypothetical protein
MVIIVVWAPTEYAFVVIESIVVVCGYDVSGFDIPKRLSNVMATSACATACVKSSIDTRDSERNELIVYGCTKLEYEAGGTICVGTTQTRPRTVHPVREGAGKSLPLTPVLSLRCLACVTSIACYCL